ncbi:phospholipase C [Skermania piniformis]|uniref:phospholipase C n=1 Tax=Skermania pinensis TaxID=39122 RepID=A0ABX8S4A5_9ACTN|nr:alkaline phosphatase family protein [Skermania piniformis]QXQ12568.1 twin-arginine translocation signal domain-containing protein [Skermania piniformis]
MNRRDFLARAGVVGGLATLSAWADPIVQRAYAADPNGTGGLGDIDHFVFLMQENRSFDHYFGTMSGVCGFDDPTPAWQQYGWTPGVGPTALPGRSAGSAPEPGYVNPFRLDTTRGPSLNGACVNDPDHSWWGMHQAWNGGRNDGWMPMSIASVGPANAPAAMGYHTRADIPVHWELAEAFTVCDHYHCSVLGPTDPNRLYWISGTIDPAGRAGGPLVETPTFIPKNVYSWRTMPENLSEAGVSWKVYNNRDVGPLSTVVLDGMIGCFTQAADPNSELNRRGIAPSYPDDFRADVLNGTLPHVSWVIPSIVHCEHPALPPALGAVGIVALLDILTANPAVWEKTALIVSYDENGGFFDHVTPPTPPPGTPGEFLTVDLGRVSSSKGIAGPIGLGYRVPALVISPYSRGGLVASQTFDHTSQLRLLETRFGVPVPNLTPWRRSVTGDLTSAFDFAVGGNPARPSITDPGPGVGAAAAQCGPNVALGSVEQGAPYPVPPNAMPRQEPGARRAPSGLV